MALAGLDVANLCQGLGEGTAERHLAPCVKPRIQSRCGSPDLARQLLDDTGQGQRSITRTSSAWGYRQEGNGPLASCVAQVHLRQARPKALQARLEQGTISLPALFGTLRDAGYRGALALEAVHQAWMGTLGDDVMTETVAMRDAFDEWRGA